MRGFFTFILFIVFFLSAFLAVITYSINAFLQPSHIKEKLVQSNIYQAAAKSIPELINQEDKAKKKDPLEATAQKILQEEISASYIQNKMEPFIDSLHAWAFGQNENPPRLDLSDLNKRFEERLKVAAKGQPIPNDMRAPFPNLKIEPNENLLKVRTALGYLKIAPLALGAIAIAALVLIVLLATSAKSRLRKIALAFFVPAIFGLLAAFVVAALAQAAPGLISEQLGGKFGELGAALENLVKSGLKDFIMSLAIIYGGFIIISVITFIAASFFKSQVSQ